MSQEKVDRYKKEKAHRKQTVKKEKLQNVFRKCAVGLVVLLLGFWIGYSAYGSYASSRPKEEVEIDYTALTDFSEKLDEAAEDGK